MEPSVLTRMEFCDGEMFCIQLAASIPSWNLGQYPCAVQTNIAVAGDEEALISPTSTQDEAPQPRVQCAISAQPLITTRASWVIACGARVGAIAVFHSCLAEPAIPFLGAASFPTLIMLP
jgi:hypothetical protein